MGKTTVSYKKIIKYCHAHEGEKNRVKPKMPAKFNACEIKKANMRVST